MPTVAKSMMQSSRALSSAGKRLLKAARGNGPRVMKVFPLTVSQFREPALATPSEFHRALCEAIRGAKRRVYVCSLYVGPAAGVNSTKERELLDAFSSTQAPDVKILLDKNRGLRPVPNKTKGGETSSITSAEACYNATKTGKVYLLSVLSTLQQQILPNPFNEARGVFHLKCYICDDNLILSGANLSEEYFTDRTDRYLWIKKSDLVDCYASMALALCRHADVYQNGTVGDLQQQTTTHKELLSSLLETLTEDAPDLEQLESNETTELAKAGLQNGEMNSCTSEDPIVAYGVPTFQAPPHFFDGLENTIPSDIAVVNDVIKAVDSEEASEIRLASAYLNLTDEMMRSMSQCSYRSVHLLTAGLVSHGFKPNPTKVGNKGKAWIPAAFDTLGRRGATSLRDMQKSPGARTSLWFYQRPDWTFHAKGIWVSTSTTESDQNDDLKLADESSLCVVTHGSGNYGGRSTYCDMESNVVLVLPPGPSSVKSMFMKDWNDMCDHAAAQSQEEEQFLSRRHQLLLPLFRWFL